MVYMIVHLHHQISRHMRYQGIPLFVRKMIYQIWCIFNKRILCRVGVHCRTGPTIQLFGKFSLHYATCFYNKFESRSVWIPTISCLLIGSWLGRFGPFQLLIF